MPVAMQEIPDLVRRLLFRSATSLQSEARTLLALGGCDHRLIESQHAPALLEHAAQLFPKPFDAITVHDADCPAIKAVVGAPANGVLHGAQICRRHIGVNPERHARPEK